MQATSIFLVLQCDLIISGIIINCIASKTGMTSTSQRLPYILSGRRQGIALLVINVRNDSLEIVYMHVMAFLFNACKHAGVQFNVHTHLNKLAVHQPPPLQPSSSSGKYILCSRSEFAWVNFIARPFSRSANSFFSCLYFFKVSKQSLQTYPVLYAIAASSFSISSSF